MNDLHSEVTRRVLEMPSRYPCIEHVLFDHHGVLSDDAAWRRWLFALVGRMGLHSHYAAFFRVWDREFQPDVWSGHTDFWVALSRFLRASGLSRGQVDEIVASTKPKMRGFRNEIRPFPGVQSALRRLGDRGATLTVVSRIPVPRDEFQVKLDRWGLNGTLGELDCQSEPNRLQPPRDFFVSITGRQSWQPERVAYVGRDPVDLSGAAAAGLFTIAYNYDADAVANVYLEQFDQLPELIDCRPPMLAAG